jgi:hypothetical protein
MSVGRYAGVDWASEEHAACVVDERGRIIEGRCCSHNEPEIGALCARLLRCRLRWWRSSDPDQVKAMRPRFSVAGGKSAEFDSFVLAGIARTDNHHFRALEPDSDQTKALRAMTGRTSGRFLRGGVERRRRPLSPTSSNGAGRPQLDPWIPARPKRGRRSTG